MTELETLLSLNFSKFSKFQKKQSDALFALVELQSESLLTLTEQVNRLTAQLKSLNESNQS